MLSLLLAPLCCGAAELPESFSPSDAFLELTLSCPGDWLREYVLTVTSLVFRDAANGELGKATELSAVLEPKAAGTIFAAALSSTFPDLPKRVGDRIYIADGSDVGRFWVEVSTRCEAALSLRIPGFSHSVSYAHISLAPADVVEALQRHAGELDEHEG
jgi:hypothetical protein